MNEQSVLVAKLQDVTAKNCSVTNYLLTAENFHLVQINSSKGKLCPNATTEKIGNVKKVKHKIKLVES